MINRRNFLGVGSAALVMATTGRSAAKNRAKTGVLLMNRIAPSSSDLYIANPDGTGERKFLQTPGFDYNASFSADGSSVVFTSERNGDGNSDVFRCRVDGTGIHSLITGPAVDDAATLSPNGSQSRLRLDAKRVPRQRLGYGCQKWPDAQRDRRRPNPRRAEQPE